MILSHPNQIDFSRRWRQHVRFLELIFKCAGYKSEIVHEDVYWFKDKHCYVLTIKGMIELHIFNEKTNDDTLSS